MNFIGEGVSNAAAGIFSSKLYHNRDDFSDQGVVAL